MGSEPLEDHKEWARDNVKALVMPLLLSIPGISTVFHLMIVQVQKRLVICHQFLFAADVTLP